MFHRLRRNCRLHTSIQLFKFHRGVGSLESLIASCLCPRTMGPHVWNCEEIATGQLSIKDIFHKCIVASYHVGTYAKKSVLETSRPHGMQRVCTLFFWMSRFSSQITCSFLAQLGYISYLAIQLACFICCETWSSLVLMMLNFYGIQFKFWMIIFCVLDWLLI